MFKNDFKLPQELYAKHLNYINHIKFTQREIDIIAFLVNGRSAKKIAAFFGISPKTVANHVSTITQKLGCNSREGIIDFIEKSQKLLIIREYHSILLTNAAFEEALKAISCLNGHTPLKILLIHPDTQNHISIEQHIQTHLNSSGFDVSILAGSEDKIIKKNGIEQAIRSNDHFIYIAPQLDVKDSKTRKHVDIFHSLQKEAQSKNNIIILTTKACDNGIWPQELSPLKVISLAQEHDYYHFIFKLIKNILPELNLDPLLRDFKKRYDAIHESGILKYLKSQFDENISKPNESCIKSSFYIPKYLVWSISVTLILGSILLVFLTYSNNKETTKQVANLNLPQRQNITAQKNHAIRSDLSIPTEAVLLNRTNLLEQINNTLQNQSGIRTIALVGVGGAGKTTIARQYARSQDLHIVWELNAETSERLEISFENLATALTENEDDKIRLRELQTIKNQTEKIAGIIQFVKEHLSSHPNWLLIFDNVDHFCNIAKFFPQDPSTWGTGKIIITSRNITLQNNKLINDIIQIEVLGADEKLMLFNKIINHGDKCFFKTIDYRETRKFLEEIPSLPLDITLSAYYLVATKIPLKKYIRHLTQDNKNFENLQEKLLEESGDYTNTRYRMVTLSLEKFTNAHPDFKGLLLLISLLDSQHIPRDLLEAYKDDVVVDSFIYYLKQYSLITSDDVSSFHSTPTLSIHRSTQALIFSYMAKILNLNEDKSSIMPLLQALNKYLSETIDQEDFTTMKLMSSHCEAILKNDQLLNETISGILGCELGGIYFHLGDYERAKELLEQSLTNLNGTTTTKSWFAQTLAYLGIVYRNLGYYEKAQQFLEKSADTYKKNQGAYDGLARALAFLASVYRESGLHEKAREVLEKNLVLYQSQLNKDPIGLARISVDLGNAYRSIGEYEKAKSLLEQALKLYEKCFSKDHFRVAWTLAHLSNAYRSLGQYEHANTLLERSYSICRGYSTENYVGYTWILTRLGISYKEIGQYEKAQFILEQSLAFHKRLYGEESVRTAWVEAHLGNVFRKIGDLEKAKDLIEESLAKHRKIHGSDHMKTAWALIQLGHIYEELGNNTQALICFETSYNIYNKYFTEGHLKLINILWHLGNVHKNLGNYEKAEELLKQTHLVYEQQYGKDHIEVGRVLGDIGEVYLLERNINAAEHYIKISLSIFLQHGHADRYIPLERYAELQLQKAMLAKSEGDLKKYEVFKLQAQDALKQAHKIVTTQFSKTSSHFLRIQEKLNYFAEEKKKQPNFFQNLLQFLSLKS